MALTAAGLSAAIKAELDARAPAEDAEGGASGSAWRKEFADALAAAIVDHIKANAQVTVTSVSGVTPGGGASGPGTGTIS